MKNNDEKNKPEVSRIILASTSPYRKSLLAKLRLDFDVFAPNLDESALPGETPYQTVHRLATEKALACAKQFPDAICIGADTDADFEGVIMGKPNNHENAIKQLTRFSGKKLVFHTGICIYNPITQKTITEVIDSTVYFRVLNRSQIENYLRIQQPYHCSGSLKSEDFGCTIMEKFEGDDFNALVGLPLIRLVRLLEQCGVCVI